MHHSLVPHVTLDRKKHVSIEIIQNAFLEVKARGKARRTARNVAARLMEYYTTCSESFLYHIGGLFFGLSYGVSQVVVIRWASNAPKLQAGSNHVDFGQIMTLALLVLPLLAAVEIFHGTTSSHFEFRPILTRH